jgi:ABC-type branched-subunit amino acid transport system substrate-binding protein
MKVGSKWKYFYRAADQAGNTIDFLLPAHRDKVAARRYFEKSIAQNGEPETVTIDKSGANLPALEAMPKGKEFEAKFSKYGKPVLFSPYAYDATWVLIKAMKAANSMNRADILTALGKVSFNGVTGKISFDDKGDLQVARVTIFKVVDGRWKGVDTVPVSK